MNMGAFFVDRKTLLAAILGLLVSLSANAQIPTFNKEETRIITEETEDGKIVTTTEFVKNTVFTNGLWYNWEFIAATGPHVYFGENDWKVKNKLEMITYPAIDLNLTKWISPSFGLGFGLTGGHFKGLYQSAEKMWGDNSVGANFQTPTLYTDADPKYDYQRLALQRGWFADLYVSLHIDWGSVFGGYDPNRFFTVDSYIGGGLMLGFDKPGTIPSAAANLGLLGKFKIGERLKLVLNVRGALVADDFDGELYVQEPSKSHWDANHKMDGNLGITVGLAWNIGKEKSSWTPARRVSRIYTKNDPDPRVIVQKDTVVVEKDPVVVKNVPEVWFHINFVVDRWEIVSRERVNLHAISDLIKSTPDVKYLVCGYADKQTATPEHNQMLSENRCKAVYNMLVNEFGVDPDQLVMDWKGGVDYMYYNEKELSRCVMITSIKE